MNENFSNVELAQTILKDAIEYIVNFLKSCFAIICSTFWSNFGPYIIGIIVILILGVAFQVLLKKSDEKNQLPSRFNKLIGCLVNLLFLFLIGFISYKIWGSKVIDGTLFALFGLISFILTKIFLRIIGFWSY